MNGRISKWLWWLVLLGLIATIPFVYNRMETERSTKNVEIVFDFRDLLEAAAYRSNPEAYINQRLTEMKAAGIGSMAMYESSLDELRTSRHIQVYSQQEYSLLTGKPLSPREAYTYLLFTSEEARNKIQPILEQTYSKRLGAAVSSWSYNNRPGLIIELPYEEANTKALEPNPILMDMLQKEGFQLVLRLSNRMQPYSEEELDSLLHKMSQRGIKRIVFDGYAVTGFDEEPEDNQVMTTAALMKKYEMGVAVIDRLKVQQRGMHTAFAKELDYNVVRLFPLYDTEVSQPPEAIADKLVLAVKDRNLRMLFLNTRAARDMEKGYIKDYIDPLLESLTGPEDAPGEGAVSRIEKLGYQLGEAHAFVPHGEVWKPLKPVLLVAGTALIALTIGLFFPPLVTASFAIGAVGVLGLYSLSQSLSLQALAFGVAVCTPILATILAIRYIRKQKWSNGMRWLRSVAVFLGATILTLGGVLYVVALLSGVTYYLVLEQFRGVTMLHLLPIVLVAVYALLFAEVRTLREWADRLKRLLFTQITVFWVVLAGVVITTIYYYLTRTGNEGQASQVEKLIRTYLENGLGVRPRFKEFIFAHPLFIFAVYLYMKHRQAVFLFAAAVMGQLSIVDTFAHLHTPLYLSFARVGLGLAFGIIISLAYVAVWEMLVKGWRKWAPK